MHEEQCSTAEEDNYLSSYVMQDSSQHPHPPPLLACMRMKTHRSIIGARYEMPPLALLVVVVVLWHYWRVTTRDGSQSSVSRDNQSLLLVLCRKQPTLLQETKVKLEVDAF